jgi:hypothetical protein
VQKGHTKPSDFLSKNRNSSPKKHNSRRKDWFVVRNSAGTGNWPCLTGNGLYNIKGGKWIPYDLCNEPKVSGIPVHEHLVFTFIVRVDQQLQIVIFVGAEAVIEVKTGQCKWSPT